MSRAEPADLCYQQLKTRQRAERGGYPQSLALRVHRALSWLNRAEQETDDQDARFIFLWIAFNAAYATEMPASELLVEKSKLRIFFDRVVALDNENVLYHILWDQFPQPVRLLIENRYVFQPFWNFQGGHEAFSDWEMLFERANTAAKKALGSGDTAQLLTAAKKALGSGDTAQLLTVVFDRLYTLRNQLVHGGATWNSSVNRDQVRDGVNILGKLVPAVIALMMDHPGKLWGEPHYPVVEQRG